MWFKGVRYFKRAVLIATCLSMSVSLQASPVQRGTLENWILQKEGNQTVTRQEAGELITEVMGVSFNKLELNQRPSELLTREGMALMVVNVLGYEDIANKLGAGEKPFNDVENNRGAVALIKDLGLMKGDEDGAFRPTKAMTRQEVASVLSNLIIRLEAPIQKVHSSYAIQANTQMAFIKNLDEVSFGWSEVSFDEAGKEVRLSTVHNASGFNLPDGFEEPLSFAKANNIPSYLMVYLEDKTITSIGGEEITLANYIFTNEAERTKLIEKIVSLCREISKGGISGNFEGVTIDFENFRSKDLQQGFNVFLKELKVALDKENKKLNVAVQPAAYYKGYDYKTIGSIADGVILMAHDYEAKRLTAEEMASGFTITPITPISSIYTALKEITDSEKGVEDKSKIMLQISFGSAQWQLQNQKIINERPYTPSYDKIVGRLQQEGTQIIYSDLYQNPYAIYDDGKTKNIIWYENSQSVEAKINLARLFDIHQISLWRLGTIPDYNNTYDEIKLDMASKLGLN